MDGSDAGRELVRVNPGGWNMAITNQKLTLSSRVHEHRNVNTDERFNVFSRGLLESLQRHFSADFSVLVKDCRQGTFGTSNPQMLLKIGSTSEASEARVLNFLETCRSEESASKANPHLLTHRLQLSEETSVTFVVGYKSDEKISKEEQQHFSESLDRVHSEVADVFLISQQSLKIAELRDRMEEAEDLLISSNLSITAVDDEVNATNTGIETVFGVRTSSPKMKSLLNQVSKVGGTNLSLFIKGEIGTGKAFIARKIHDHTTDDDSPFEMISCGSLNPNLVEGELFGWKKGAFSGAEEDRPGLFERAHGGTVFLDEVGELPLEIQQKLLRVIQEGVVRPVGSSELVQVNCRLMSSSCRELKEFVEKGDFREDLYYRLAGFQLEVPCLRDRSEDLGMIINEMLNELHLEHGVTKRFSESALIELKSYSWPGNIQQLKNVIQQSYLISEKRMIARKVILSVLNESVADSLVGEKFEVTHEEICIRIPRTEGFNEIISEVERAVILAALRQNRGNKSRVTKQLKIPRQTLYNKIDRFGFTDEDLRG